MIIILKQKFVNDNYSHKKTLFIIMKRQIASLFNSKNLTILVGYIYKWLKLRIMKLNTKSRYAVMALADMAVFSNNNAVCLRDISLRQGISLLYLEQIFLKLKKNNIVKSVRGINGGYIIVKNPKELKISDILLALDQKIKTIGCKKDSKKSCNGKSTKCITHHFWDELDIHINSFFENKKLSDLLKNREARI